MRFSSLLRIGLALIMVASLGGCTTTPPAWCAAIGAGYGAIGGGVGGGLYSANNTDRDNNELEGAGIAAASMLVGAGVGYLACNLAQQEKKPEPRQATPTPPPEPAPPPPPPPKPDPCTQLVRLEGVKFDNDKSELGPNAGAILDETIAALQRCPEKRVRLNAHTDSVGSEQYNEALSQRRADSVRAYLVSHGIAASRIEAHGFGESNPIADNSTPEGRAQNRRVELEPID
jgi:OOP family OmpA-OmpF porin